jgi:hypothetical protein
MCWIFLACCGITNIRLWRRLTRDAVPDLAGSLPHNAMPLTSRVFPVLRDTQRDECAPHLLTVHDVPRPPIEERLSIMFLKHRMRGIGGSFRANADYAPWNGWAEMVRDLRAIKVAAALRKDHPEPGVGAQVQGNSQ